MRGEVADSSVHRFRVEDRQLPRDIAVHLGASFELPTEVFALDRSDPTGARGLLRIAAAHALGTAAAEVVLHPPRTRRIGPFRPPHPGWAGIGPGGRRGVWVSLSRAGGLVAVAVGRRRIGIDVEALQSFDEAADLVRVLHPADRRAIEALTAGHPARSPGLEVTGDMGLEVTGDMGLEVTGVWTRVEAALKLRGTGLRRDPATIRVGTSSSPRGPGRSKILTQELRARADDGSTTSATPTHLLSIAWI